MKIIFIFLYQFSGCVGWITLLSSKNEDKIVIESKKLQKAMKRRRKGHKIIKRNIKERGMRFASVNGNCCWEVRERVLGGETKELWNPHTYYLPWSIQSVKMIDC